MENELLRLKGEYEYTGGDTYKDFELLVDAPEIPVTRSDVTPRHAIKGDILRERYGDELTPFQLRRDGKRIGDPEWWAIRHLFDGLSEPEPARDGLLMPTVLELKDGAKPAGWQLRHDCPEAGVEEGAIFAEHPRTYAVGNTDTFFPWGLWTPTEPGAWGGVTPTGMDSETAEGLLALDKLERDPKYTLGRRLVGDTPSAYVEVNGLTDLRAGDILVRSETRPELGGVVSPLGLEHYAELREAYKADSDTFTSLAPFVRRTVSEFVRSPNRWGKKLKVWRPRLWRVRYPVEVVSSPIIASTDLGAIFELLESVGCRMPAKEEAHV